MSELLTRAQVAERLGIALSTLGDWVKAGKFPPPSVARPGRTNRYIRWYASVVEDWKAGRWKGEEAKA